MTLKVLIVDDEALARRRLATMLRQIVDVEIAGEAEDGDEALELIRERHPDVVLLDIKMPGKSGFDLVPLLEGPAVPVVIFVTAFNHYAVKAFEVAAVDYLLKPVAFDRLQGALTRAREVLKSRDSESRVAEMAGIIETLRQGAAVEAEAPRFESEFWVQRRAEYLRVPVARLDWIEAERDYVRLHAGNEAYLLRDTISGLDERLDPSVFIRVHRSAIVRRERIVAIRQAGYGAIKVALSTGIEVPVSRTYVHQVRQILHAKAATPAA